MCTTVAFINQISLWMETLVICWIVLYMLTLTVRILKTPTMHDQLPNDDETPRIKYSNCLEYFSVHFFPSCLIGFHLLGKCMDCRELGAGSD